MGNGNVLIGDCHAVAGDDNWVLSKRGFEGHIYNFLILHKWAINLDEVENILKKPKLVIFDFVERRREEKEEAKEEEERRRKVAQKEADILKKKSEKEKKIQEKLDEKKKQQEKREQEKQSNKDKVRHQHSGYGKN